MASGSSTNVAQTAATAAGALQDASAEEKASVQIGLIGMGDMGRLYASRFVAAGWQHINVCDQPKNYQRLKDEFAATTNIKVLQNGHLVSRISDFVIYSVEAAYLADAVAAYGPCACDAWPADVPTRLTDRIQPLSQGPSCPVRRP